MLLCPGHKEALCPVYLGQGRDQASKPQGMGTADWFHTNAKPQLPPEIPSMRLGKASKRVEDCSRTAAVPSMEPRLRAKGWGFAPGAGGFAVGFLVCLFVFVFWKARVLALGRTILPAQLGLGQNPLPAQADLLCKGKPIRSGAEMRKSRAQPRRTCPRPSEMARKRLHEACVSCSCLFQFVSVPPLPPNC